MSKDVGKQFIFAALSVGIGLAGFLVVAEVGTRLVVPESRWRFRDAADDWVRDARAGWVQKPNIDVTTATEHGWEVHFQTNADGLTPPTATREKPAGALRVMLFGDSAVVGRSVPQDQTVHAHLERILRGAGLNVDVVNAGVQGYATDQALVRMEQLVPLYKPDIILHGVCDNDFGGNVVSDFAGLGKVRFTLKPDGSLEEHPPPAGADVAKMGEGPGRWLQLSAFYRVLQPSLLVLRTSMGTWSGRNLMGLGDEAYYNPQELERRDWALFKRLLTRMKGTATTNGAQFVMYLHPAISEVWEPVVQETLHSKGIPPEKYDRYAIEKRVKSAADETGIGFVPLIDSFRAQQARGPFHLLPRDPHCNGRGYELQAEALAKQILSKEPARPSSP
ncbi:MAG: hypothetical protein AB2A00_00250 [Myxococcota bacterium]